MSQEGPCLGKHEAVQVLVHVRHQGLNHDLAFVRDQAEPLHPLGYTP